ncbi:uncharacterized protein LOC133176605 [Saccostrea echinata]|uniref:uncharacterized protein LOC133176605 n=1 Tax=Saccostrea echinata TaxID=191078 RepID=UPI002A7F4792|nr:uncharacterized protein LOC133176605 [Saccostrea echinata]
MGTIILILLLCGLNNAQFTYPSTAEQCASRLACSLNYSKIFDSKINELTYRHNLDLYTLRNYLNGKLLPLQHETEVLKLNTSAMLESFGREISNTHSMLSQDREFMSNLSQGFNALGKSLHGEIGVRMDDVHRLVLEVKDVQHTLTLLQTQINDLKGSNMTGQTPKIVQPAQHCPADNATIDEMIELRKNNTFLERVYKFATASLRNLTSVVAARDRKILALQQELQSLRIQSSKPLISSTCDTPLGMANGTISDSAITASESHVNYSPAGARINSKTGWYTNDKSVSHDWIQVDLGEKKYVTKLATQGAPCCDVRVTNYTIQYSSDGVKWRDLQENCQKKYFDGNTDQTSIKLQNIDPPLLAQHIRLNVVDFNRKSNNANNYVGMRFEMYGCSFRS